VESWPACFGNRVSVLYLFKDGILDQCLLDVVRRDRPDFVDKEDPALIVVGS
jgi:hypothetical protein